MVDTTIRFRCPKCAKRLKAGPEACGRRAKCTRCHQPVMVPEYASAPPPLPATSPTAEQHTDATWWDEIPILAGGKQQSHVKDADLTEQDGERRHRTPAPERRRNRAAKSVIPVPVAVDTAADEPEESTSQEPSCGNPIAKLNLTAVNGVQAQQTLAAIRKALPETASAYTPSGRIPAGGFVFLFAGAGVGAIAAAVVRTILIVLGFFALGFLATIVANMKDVMAVIGAIVLVIGALAYFGFVYFAAGATTAYCMRLFGRMGKSRSPVIEATISACSVGFAVVMMWLVSLAYTAESPDARGNMSADTLQVVATLEAIVGGLIAIISAAMISVSLVKKAKFCEHCEAHMCRKIAKSIPLVDLHPIVGRLADRDFCGFQAALAEAPTGTGGKVETHTCPRCGDGFLELHAGCAFSWKEGNKTKTLAKEWLVQSMRIGKDELELAVPVASN